VPEPTIIAIDWSGAKEPRDQRKGICAAIAGPDGITPSAGRTREQTIDFVERHSGPCVVGFDFCFGAPAWFAREQGCSTVDALWTRASQAGEQWIGPPPTLPFWKDKGMQPPRDRRFRQCEEELKRRSIHPSSIFMLVGPANVGTGSVRGMPLLTRLREAGFAIWPFDAPSDRTVVEIFPTLLEPLAPRHLTQRDYANDDERDAVLSAAVMWEHRESFAALRAATDPVTRIEGDVWVPSSSL
jgi:hypothetical protein